MMYTGFPRRLFNVGTNSARRSGIDTQTFQNNDAVLKTPPTGMFEMTQIALDFFWGGAKKQNPYKYINN